MSNSVYSESYNSTFATTLRNLLQSTNTKQGELAKAIGVKRPAISQYVNGVTEPSASKLKKIADFFNVTTDYLLGANSDGKDDLFVYFCEYSGLTTENVEKLHSLGESFKFAFEPFGEWTHKDYCYDLLNDFISFFVKIIPALYSISEINLTNSKKILLECMLLESCIENVSILKQHIEDIHAIVREKSVLNVNHELYGTRYQVDNAFKKFMDNALCFSSYEQANNKREKLIDRMEELLKEQGEKENG